MLRSIFLGLVFWSILIPLSAQTSVSDLLRSAQKAESVEALRYYLEALQITKKDSASAHLQAKIEEEIGHIYQREGLHEKALSYFSHLIQGNDSTEAHLLEDAAISAFALQNYSLARTLYQKSLSIHQAKNDIPRTL
ncbi:MAG: tetratricopeptide repeat protein, partial [Bacteroidota bacterium]